MPEGSTVGRRSNQPRMMADDFDATPTPQEPEAYLALPKFSRRITCPRTRMPVSYADMGEAEGVPLLWMMPSGGSRWFAAAHDPLCRRYGVRLIVVDRPGIGATPVVPLEKRVDVSCQMIKSVLEHLDVRPAHILAASAGVYYALYLLANHADIFLTGLNPPPRVYLISPWSPLLPPDHPDYYPSYFTWIPTPLIATQHYTLPGLMKAGQQAATAWNAGQKAWTSARTWMKGWNNQTAEPGEASTNAHETVEEDPAPDAPPVPQEIEEIETVPREQEDEAVAEDPPRKPLWGPTRCCISCLVTEYFNAENFEGVGQDHLLCLNRGQANSGPEWFERTLLQLDASLLSAQGGVEGKAAPRRIPLHIWWGWQDSMVPRKGQLWLNKTLGGHPESLEMTIHDVEDGDHNDLLGRRDGIYQVYDMVSRIGHITQPIPDLDLEE